MIMLQGFMAEHMTVCGGHLSAATTPTSLFSHAKFGDVNYDNKEDCDWIIEAPAGNNVQLSFNNFQLEDEQDCGYDFIEVSLWLTLSGMTCATSTTSTTNILRGWLGGFSDFKVQT